jgi:hypothetical protein
MAVIVNTITNSRLMPWQTMTHNFIRTKIRCHDPPPMLVTCDVSSIGNEMRPKMRVIENKVLVMDYTKGPSPPRVPRTDWWVLMTANAGTSGLTCFPNHGETQKNKYLVTHPMTDLCEHCLTFTIGCRAQ